MDSLSARDALLSMGEKNLVDRLEAAALLLNKEGWTWCGVTCSCVACCWPKKSALGNIINNVQSKMDADILKQAQLIIESEFNRRFLTPCAARMALDAPRND